MKLMLTGERFNGRRAVEVGLAHRAVPRENLYAAVQEEVEMINLGGPNAIVETKKLVNRKPKPSLEEDFEECAEWSLRMFQSEEGAEGMAAFREKRKAAWIQG